MVWVGSDLTEHLVSSPLPQAGTLPLERLLKAPSNLALNTSKERGIHIFSRQPVPTPHSKEFISFIKVKSTFFQLEAITDCPIATCPCKKVPLQLSCRPPSCTGRLL